MLFTHYAADARFSRGAVRRQISPVDPYDTSTEPLKSSCSTREMRREPKPTPAGSDAGGPPNSRQTKTNFGSSFSQRIRVRAALNWVLFCGLKCRRFPRIDFKNPVLYARCCSAECCGVCAGFGCRDCLYVRCGAHYGPKSGIARGPKGARIGTSSLDRQAKKAVVRSINQ